MHLLFVIYHENHNKVYYFTNTGELKSAPFSTFPFGTKFVWCKDQKKNLLTYSTKM